MPTNRRRRQPQRRIATGVLDQHQYADLIVGDPLMPSGGFGSDLDAFRRAWRTHGEAIVEAFAERFPGHRPYAWWALDGVPKHGERLLIREPFEIPSYLKPGETVLIHHPDPDGLAAVLRRGDRFGICHTHYLPPLQESEADYLERHGLLLRGEAGRIDPALSLYGGAYSPWRLARDLAAGDE